MPERNRRDWTFLFPIAYGALVFAPMLANGFIRDDFTWVATAIESARDPALLFGPPKGDFRPLAGLLFRLNLAISGLEPAGYYAVNLLLHLANVALVTRLAFLLTGGSRGIALLAGTLFAGAFGNYGDAVSWISGRTGLLADLFLLSTVLAFWSFLETGRGRAYAWSLAFFVLALLSKETAVVVLPLLILTEWTRGAPGGPPARRRALRVYAPFALLLAAYLILQLAVVRRASDVIGREYVLGGHAVAHLAEYLARMVVPLNDTSSMVPLPHGWREPLRWAQTALAVLVPLGWAALFFAPTPRWARYGVLWMVLNLLPYTFFLARTSTRYLYNPSIGYCVLVSGFLWWWGARAARAPGAGRLWRRLPAAVAVGILAAQAVTVTLVILRHRADARLEEVSGREWLLEKVEATRRAQPR